jgi:hypothetical protein
MRISTSTARLPSAVAVLLAALASAAAIAGYSAAPAQAKAKASLRPLTTGVSYVYGNEPLEFEHVKSTGAKQALGLLRWWAVAPKTQPANWNPEDPADPHYNWKEIDAWVVNAVAAGIRPVLQVRGAPTWAQGCPEIEHDAPCKPDPAALEVFAKAAARRYSGHFNGLPRVRYWQGLNEPNLSLFFQPQYEGSTPVSPLLYSKLINAFYAGIKSVDPSNLVIAAGLGPIAVPGFTIGPMRFTRILLCMKGGRPPRPLPGDCEGGVHFDIFDIHPYTSGGPSHEGGANDVELGDFEKLQTLLAAADRAGRIKGTFKRTPLWVIEFSWDSNPPDPGGLPMSIETQWTSEALYRAWKAGVENFFWFSLVDFEPEPSRPFDQTLQAGLFFWAPTLAAQQPKENLYAFRFPFLAFHRRNGLFVWGRTPSSSGGKVRIQVFSRDSWRGVATLRADSHGMFATTLPTQYGRDKRGFARVTYRGEPSLPFPMRRVGDFPQAPFG